jgi:molybdenum cofactor synthesis domain-containing protein
MQESRFQGPLEPQVGIAENLFRPVSTASEIGLRANNGRFMIRASIVTVSDRGAAGEREDRSGPAIREMIAGFCEIVDYRIVPDEIDEIRDAIVSMSENADLVITTGGTGVSPRDVTPEATRKVIEKDLPGMTEAMRHESMKKTPYAMISRAVAGIRGSTLIINLPGSEKAARENLSVILPALPHAVEKIKGSTEECGS